MKPEDVPSERMSPDPYSSYITACGQSAPWCAIIPPMALSVRPFFMCAFNPRPAGCTLCSQMVLFSQQRCTKPPSIHPDSLADWTLLFVRSWTLSLFTLEMIMTSCVHSCTICIHAACSWTHVTKWMCGSRSSDNIHMLTTSRRGGFLLVWSNNRATPNRK